MKTLSKSRTVWFNMFMAGIETTHGTIHLLAPMLPVDTFAVITMVLGLVHAVGGVYMRSITSAAIK